MEGFIKLKKCELSEHNLNELFMAIDSPMWRSPEKVSVQSILDCVKFDPSTLTVEVSMPKNDFNVFGEKFIDQNINYYTPPKNASAVTGMHMMTDGNYLYIWVENRWKRTPLSEW